MEKYYISSETTLAKEITEKEILYYKNEDKLEKDTSSQEDFSETDFKNEIKREFYNQVSHLKNKKTS